jgi:hypothetical protein
MYHKMVRKYVRFVEGLQQQDSDVLGPASSIVEFSFSDQNRPHVFFAHHHGTPVRPPTLRQYLADGESVYVDQIKRIHSSIQFCDHQPPVPLLLTYLWNDVFPASRDSAEYDENAKVWKIEVDLRQLTRELQAEQRSF